MIRSEVPDIKAPEIGKASSKEKRIAQRLVQKAVKNGTLIRQPCEVCGTAENIHAHHNDYSRPLDVRWLCVSHHVLEHPRPPRDFDIDAQPGERQVVAILKAFGCLTDDGRLTGELEAILKRQGLPYAEVAS